MLQHCLNTFLELTLAKVVIFCSAQQSTGNFQTLYLFPLSYSLLQKLTKKAKKAKKAQKTKKTKKTKKKTTKRQKKDKKDKKDKQDKKTKKTFIWDFVGTLLGLCRDFVGTLLRLC